MGVLFISHSSQNNTEAVAVRDWLRSQGYGEIFLDLDPQQGLAPGERWQSELKKAGETCAAVIVLISPQWAASSWCRTEFLVASQLGKCIFPVLIAPTPFGDLPGELTANLQMADISDPAGREDGFDRLAIGLRRAGLDPSSFPWPPDADPARNPYRGLQALDVQDAAVFFGRDVKITGALDLLRRMRADGTPNLMVILGSSGAGKSSFLRAGILSRLANDSENFIVPPILRPGNAALSGPTGLFQMLGARIDTPEDILACFERMRETELERLRRYAEAGGDTVSNPPPSIVIALDQAEELYSSENREAERAVALLAQAVAQDANAFIVATIRSDNYSAMQIDPALTGLPRTLFNLGPMSHANFREVIEGPARYASPPLQVEPRLTERLLDDLDQDDALPLLGFTLERLAQLEPPAARMTVKGYRDRLGGLGGAIRKAVDQALSQAREDPALPDTAQQLLDLARSAFIPWLVSLEAADADPRRRVANLSEIPDQAHNLVRLFVDHRLLVSSTRTVAGRTVTTVEVAHEAILRRWPDLAGWIDSERDFLVGKGRLDQVIKDFPRDKALVSEPLLGRARQWLIDHPDRFGSHERAFIRRSQQAAEHETARKLRLQRALTWGSAAAALVFAIIGGFALWQWDEATQARIAATAASEQATASKNAALRAQALAMREEAIARDARENAERAVVTAVNSATGLIDRLEGDLRDKDTPPKYFQDAVENTGSLLDKLFGIFPQHGAVHEALLANQQKLGDIQMQLGRYREARRIYEKAKAIAVAIADTVGTDKPHILGLAAFYEEKAAAAEKARPQLTIVVFAGDARTWPVRQVTRSVARHAGKEGDAAPAPAEVPRSLAFTKAR